MSDQPTSEERRTVRIPRVLFGLHLAAIGCLFLVWCGSQLELYGREPVIVALAGSAAVILLVRPRFVLTPRGLTFVADILYAFTVSYASIDRERIRSIKVAWEREDVVGSAGNVAYSYRRPFLGIFLEYAWNEPPRTTTLCLERLKSRALARTRAQQYAQALGCPLEVR